jgi:hypothetical protein
MSADAKLDAAVGRQAGAALDDARLPSIARRTSSTTRRSLIRTPLPVRLMMPPVCGYGEVQHIDALAANALVFSLRQGSRPWLTTR